MDSIDQFLLGVDADASKHGTRHFAEQILHQVQPRPVRGHKYEYEALRHGVQIGARLFGNMGGRGCPAVSGSSGGVDKFRPAS